MRHSFGPLLCDAGFAFIAALVLVFFAIMSRVVDEAKKAVMRQKGDAGGGSPPPMDQQQIEQRLREIVAQKKRAEAAARERIEAPMSAPAPARSAPFRERPQAAPNAGAERMRKDARTISDSAEAIGTKADRISTMTSAPRSEVTALVRGKLRSVADDKLRPADAITLRLRNSPRALRDAIVLAEVLGKPKGLREDFGS